MNAGSEGKTIYWRVGSENDATPSRMKFSRPLPELRSYLGRKDRIGDRQRRRERHLLFHQQVQDILGPAIQNTPRFDMLQPVNLGGEDVLQVVEGAPMGGDGKIVLVRLGHYGIKNCGRDWFKAATRPASLLHHLDEVHSILTASNFPHCPAGIFGGAGKSDRVGCRIDSEGSYWMAPLRCEDGARGKEARPFQGTVLKLSAKLHDPDVFVSEVPHRGDSILQKGAPRSGVEARPVNDQLRGRQDAPHALLLEDRIRRSHVDVQVDEAGHQGVPAQVQNLRPRRNLYIPVISHLHDPPVPDQDRGAMAGFQAFARQHGGAGQRQVSLLRLIDRIKRRIVVGDATCRQDRDDG